MRIRSQAQKGYSMIELLIVLAIIAALIAGAFYLYPKVQAARSANAQATILQSFQANMKSLFTTGEYSKASVLVTAQAGMWPNSMLDSQTAPTKATNEWGGAVTVTGSTSAGAACAASPCPFFEVTYPSVPSDVCQKLAPSLASSWDVVVIAAAGPTAPTAANAVVNTVATTPVVYDPTLVTSLCKSANAGGPVTFTLVSR